MPLLVVRSDISFQWCAVKYPWQAHQTDFQSGQLL